MRPLLIACLIAFCSACAAPVAAHADTYQYAFSITDLSNGDAGFLLDVDVPNLISSTGLTPLATPLATSLGYSVDNFGENSDGWFTFSEAGGAIYNIGMIYSSTTFGFNPSQTGSGYDAVGTYNGYVFGNDPFAFEGQSTLTITDLGSPTSVTPEPSSLLLLGTGLLGIGGAMRRRFS